MPDAEPDLEDPVARVTTDAADHVLAWCTRATALFGYSAAEALGQPLGALIDPEAGGVPAREATPEDEHTWHDEGLRRRNDGTLLVVATTTRMLRDAQGAVIGRLHRLADITRFRARRDAQVVAAHYQAVLESVPDAIVMVNATGRIVLVNEQAQAMFGHSREAMVGEAVERLLPERVHAAHAEHRRRFGSAPRQRRMGDGLTLHGRRRDGSEFPVEISLSPVRSEVGPLVMSAIRDITERKRIEQALQEKNVELERASRAKDQFLATMSHELRTPLNAIIGFTGLMLMRLPGPITAEQERQLQAVQTSGRHLLSLINDLLDLARIGSGKAALVREPVALAALLHEVSALLRPAALAKSLQLDVELPDGELELMTDRRALQQVLINLAGNALKFTDQGQVRLQARRDAPGWMAVCVIDSGSGIADEDLSRLFQPFSRLSGGQAQEGTGLGLHLSARLAEHMGGTLACTSRPGEGSCFILRLPSEPA